MRESKEAAPELFRFRGRFFGRSGFDGVCECFLIPACISILLGEACDRLGRLGEVLPSRLLLAHGFGVCFELLVSEFGEVGGVHICPLREG